MADGAGVPPDLRVLAAELLVAAAGLWPEVVTREDAERVRSSQDWPLVAARVMAAVARRAGMPVEAIQAATEAARSAAPAQAQQSMFEPAEAAERVDMPYDLMWRVDAALTDPAARVRVPKWFVDGYWPQYLRRVAMGERPTSRDCSVMMAVLETAGGRRG